VTHGSRTYDEDKFDCLNVKQVMYVVLADVDEFGLARFEDNTLAVLIGANQGF